MLLGNIIRNDCFFIILCILCDLVSCICFFNLYYLVLSLACNVLSVNLCTVCKIVKLCTVCIIHFCLNIYFIYLAPQVSPVPVQILPRPQLSSNSNHYWVIIFVVISTNDGCLELTCAS